MTETAFDHAARDAGFVLDSAQVAAAVRLAQLSDEVSARSRLSAGEAPRGVYLWGPVGRGKTWLADVFFHNVPVWHKRRVHFHEFFRQFHTLYARYRAEPGACDRAVTELLDDCRLLVFDEFHIHDPGDAMMIRRVLRSLADLGICLVATSNYAPEGLLPNPLYHHLAESTIELIEHTLDVVEVAGPRDYRWTASSAGTATEFGRGSVMWPGTQCQLDAAGLAPPSADERCRVDAGGRRFDALAVRDDLVWFDFRELCDANSSPIDYLRLGERFGTWVLSGVPVLSSGDRDAAQRFANLIDVLCDRDKRLYLIAVAPLAVCLTGEALPIDVARLRSRLSLLPVAA